MDTPWADGWNLMEICALIGLIIGFGGLFGNALLAWVANLTGMSYLSTSLFITAMAITDSTILIFHMLEDFGNILPNTTAEDILYGYSSWRCRISNFVYDWTSMLSSWCMVGITAELFLVQTFPHQRHLLYNSRRALYVVSSMMLIGLAGCFPVSVITWSVEPGVCSSDYERFYYVYHNVVIQLFINGIVPVIIISLALGKCAIAHIFAKTEGTVTEVNAEDNTIKIQDVDEPKAPPAHLTNAVVAITVVFVLTVTPYTALKAIVSLQKYDLTSYVTPYNMTNAIAVVRLILHANYALKFVLAFIFSRTFRTTFRIICNYGSTIHSPSMAAEIGRPRIGTKSRTTRSELYSTSGQPGVNISNSTSI